jgi:flagellar hook-length control protein FliK
VAAIAAESVTSAHGAIGARAGAGSLADISDIFAEILDDIAQDLSSGAATSPIAPADAVAPPTDPGTKSTASDTSHSSLLQSALADLRARLAPTTVGPSDGYSKKSDKPDDAKSATQGSNQDNPGLAQMLGALPPLPSAAIAASSQLALNAAPASCDPPVQGAESSDLSSDTIPLRGDEDTPPAKPARTQTSVDPVLFAGTQAVAPAANPPVLVAPADNRPDNAVTPLQPMPAAAALAADAETTDMAAAPMVSAGSIQKPAKPAPAAADSTRSELQGSTAAALAAVSTAATRVFSDQVASSAQALPLHRINDDSKTNPSNASSPPSPNSTTSDAAAPIAPPSAPAATPAASAPVQPHAAPQVTPSNAAPVAGPAVVPAPAPHGATPIAAQLQVLQSDPQDATPNFAALAVTIATKSADGAKHFDIRLDPPELGRVDVRLTVDDAGRAQAALAVEKPQTLALLQKDSPQLERALKDAGLDLSQNGLNFSLKGQQQQSGSNAPAGRQRHHTVRAIVAADSVSPLSTAVTPSGDARLDIRV